MDNKRIGAVERYRVLLDTSSLIILRRREHKLVEFKKIFSEKCECLISDGVLRELNEGNLSELQIIEKILGTKLRVINALKSGREVDDELIDLLDGKQVDFLVTQDERLRRRCLKHDHYDRILLIEEFLHLLSTLYHTELPEHRKIGNLSLVRLNAKYSKLIEDPLFDSLKADYAGFSRWWEDSVITEEREALLVKSIDGNLAGISIIKRNCDNKEYMGQICQAHLKICTFKIADRYQAYRLGERMLYETIKIAEKLRAPSIIVEINSKLEGLIFFFERFGFKQVMRKPGSENEVVLEKRLGEGVVNPSLEEMAYANHPVLFNYFSATKKAQIRFFKIPIDKRWADRLFYHPKREQKLTDYLGFQPNIYALKKFYFSCSNIRKIKAGDVLVFYLTRDNPKKHPILAVGIVLEVRQLKSVEEGVLFASNLMAYDEKELTDYFESSKSETKIGIKFLVYDDSQKDIALEDFAETYTRSIAELKNSEDFLVTWRKKVYEKQ